MVVSQRPCSWRIATPSIIRPASSCHPGRPSTASSAFAAASSDEDIIHQIWFWLSDRSSRVPSNTSRLRSSVSAAPFSAAALASGT